MNVRHHNPDTAKNNTTTKLAHRNGKTLDDGGHGPLNFASDVISSGNDGSNGTRDNTGPHFANEAFA